MIHVRYFAGAADAAGRSEAEVDVSPSVGDLLATLGSDNDRLAHVLRQCSFLVNGRVASLDEPLTDDDRIDVLPPFAGG